VPSIKLEADLYDSIESEDLLALEGRFRANHDRILNELRPDSLGSA
jgi:hypothetical protein